MQVVQIVLRIVFLTVGRHRYSNGYRGVRKCIAPANNDVATRVGASTVINIGANDSDPKNDELTTSGVTSPTKGSVSYTNNTGTSDTVTYTPLATATGTDSFTYRVSDGKGGTDTATVTINLQNNPVAGDDTITVPIGRSTVIAIGANDSDANGDQLTTTGRVPIKAQSVIPTIRVPQIR